MQLLLDETDVDVDNGLPPPFLEEEDMALPHKPTPTERIKPHISLRDRLTRFWQTRVTPHPWISVLITASFTLASIFGGGQYKYHLDHKNDGFNKAVDDRIGEVLKAPNGVLEILGQIRDKTNATATTLDTLKPYIQSLVTHQVDSASKLPTHALAEQLPAVNTLLTVAMDQKIRIQSEITSDLRKNLLKVDSSSTDYWPVAAQLVNYRSEAAVGWNRINVPDCSKDNITFSGATHLEQFSDGRAVMTRGLATFHHCALILDSSEAQNLMSQGLSVGDVTFDDCIILYNGGPINIKPIRYLHGIPPSTTLNFVKCVFLFKLASPPPPVGQRLTTELLASNTDTFRFNPIG